MHCVITMLTAREAELLAPDIRFKSRQKGKIRRSYKNNKIRLTCLFLHNILAEQLVSTGPEYSLLTTAIIIHLAGDNWLRPGYRGVIRSLICTGTPLDSASSNEARPDIRVAPARNGVRNPKTVYRVCMQLRYRIVYTVKQK